MSATGHRYGRQSADPHYGVPQRGRPFQHSQRVQGDARRLPPRIHPGRNDDRKSEPLSTNTPGWVAVSSSHLCDSVEFLSLGLCPALCVCFAHPSSAAVVGRGGGGAVIYSFLRWTIQEFPLACLTSLYIRCVIGWQPQRQEVPRSSSIIIYRWNHRDTNTNKQVLQGALDWLDPKILPDYTTARIAIYCLFWSVY